MPYYKCIVPEGSVEFEKRQEVAKAFTDIHCGSTGAPRTFVHCEFIEYPVDGDNGYDSDATYYMDGGNRAGRPEEVKQKLLSDLIGAFVEITGISPDDIDGRITEARASQTMEGGHVLPEPGEEGPEWFEHAAAD
jgi:phenylpyruvate tautomerase PptA (4-oxalocrotonate tautomerase family)